MMHRVVFIAFWVGIASAVFSTPTAGISGDSPPLGWTTTATVVNVVDGDTVDVEVRRRVRIRLLECWAPETRTRDADEKRRGLAAKQHMRQMVMDKQVTLHIPTDGSGDMKQVLTLNRLLGRLYLEGNDVSAAMVAAGHATREKQ